VSGRARLARRCWRSDRGVQIDIFRLETGKIVEHWDVLQRAPSEAANGNSMF